MEEAIKDATAMYDKKKVISEGEYAVLVNENVEPIQTAYYIRSNNRWELDTTIKNINTDESNIFCNINKSCIDVKDECENIVNCNSLLKENYLESVVDEFDNRLALNKIEMTEKIDRYMRDSLINLKQLNRLYYSELTKYDKQHFDLGLKSDIMFIEESP